MNRRQRNLLNVWNCWALRVGTTAVLQFQRNIADSAANTPPKRNLEGLKKRSLAYVLSGNLGISLLLLLFTRLGKLVSGRVLFVI